MFLLAKKYWYISIWLPLSLISYLSVFVSPALFWPAIFFAFAIPFAILFNALVLVTCIAILRKAIIFPAIGLVCGLPPLLSTLAFNQHREPVSTPSTFSVMSFNAKLFREKYNYSKFSGEVIEWTVRDSSDIKCIQEYSTNPGWSALDVTGQMAKAGYHSFCFKSKLKENPQSNGMAIFSKFPILDSGVVWENTKSTNAILYADIATGRDTLRIYNVHIQSMSLALYQLKSFDNYGYKLRELARRLRHGSISRVDQQRKLLEHCRQSPYRFLICGDFNETPYGYNYHVMKTSFRNAFEEAGRGFGFTLNGGLFFLRIDHQFFSEGINVHHYQVDRSVDTSDHFPTFATYSLD